MKNVKIFAMMAAVALAGCSTHELVNKPTPSQAGEVPIEFNVQKQNITRAGETPTSNLENVKHYNFGVWAWKVQGKNSLADMEVMNNYLVGYSNETNKIGYEHSNATTWAASTSSTSDHESPWFYEGLGTEEYAYTGVDGEKYYKTTDSDYMSNNAHQYLRYWDLAYEKTNFYFYAPYYNNATPANRVTFEKKADNSIMTFPATAIRDGYDEPQNSAYNNYSRTLGEFMYAGVQATNANLADVQVEFKHMGAQVLIRFYEDIPGYKVELIDLGADNGTFASGVATGDIRGGIQATPSVKTAGTPATYSNGTYYTTQAATVTFAESTAVPNYTPSWTGSTTATNTTPLMFKIPSTTVLSTATVAPSNLTSFAAPVGNTTSHNIIAEKSTSGAQTYSYSPTIYYPVAQPTSSTTGFTFHVSYRIIAEDNGEQITVHNATVHVPVKGTVETDDTNDSPITTVGTEYYITAWQPNVKYTYTFKITKNTTGDTNPGTAINPTDPAASTTKALYPIVFDSATIADFTEVTNVSEYVISEDTSYATPTPGE